MLLCSSPWDISQRHHGHRHHPDTAQLTHTTRVSHSVGPTMGYNVMVIAPSMIVKCKAQHKRGGQVCHSS
jgi:hypothetical protein